MENSETESKITVLDKIKSINKRKTAIIAGSVAGALAIAYFGGVAYYSGHFFNGTEIGVFDCSNMTAQQARTTIQDEIDNYGFTFYEKDGKTETIKGEEIYFNCTPVGDLTPLLQEQNPFAWVANLGSHRLPLDVEVTYNKDVLYNRITQMDFMKDTRTSMEGSVDKIKYEDGIYTVEDDAISNVVSVNNVYQRTKPKILELYQGMSLEKEDCYKGLNEDDTMKGVLNMLNKYVGAKITYQNGSNSTVLDKNTINEWITVSDDYLIRIDENKAKEYVANLAKTYDTVGKERTFKTTNGDEIKISGGSYGWLVNNQKETEELLNIIRSGETVEREPVYRQKAAVHDADDIANTYVEVSIGGQHVWYYKDGNLVLSTDCVTGNTSLGRGTHTGVYYVKYKDKNVILKGADYETPVSYWMPFNGGEGLHDATWRGSFGGSIYRGSGSHGCVNLPYSAAKTLYQNVSPGDPVIIY